METATQIRLHLDEVQEKIRLAAKRVNRNPAEIKLLVVTKTHPIEVVRAAIGSGANCLGENYAEEAIPKILACREIQDVQWHMIGHVQSRKAQMVCQNFDYLHSLDSLKLAQRLNRFALEYQKSLPVLLECNTSGESTKYGWPVFDETHWSELSGVFAQILQLPGLRVDGLMTMAPYGQDPEASRSFFRRLARFRQYLRLCLPAVNWAELSMGMSGDFEVAVEEGATWVRIGQLILGPRSGLNHISS